MVDLIRKLFASVHRRVAPIHFARTSGVRLGKNCRLVDVSFGTEPWLVSLGNHVSVSDASFITHDGGVWVFREEFPDIDYLAPITVGNNVFIGSRTIILKGVTIGNNVVIGAGSIVSKDIPSNCVAAGIPATPLHPLEEYREKILLQAEHTKGMTLSAKRDYYLKKYSLK